MSKRPPGDELTPPPGFIYPRSAAGALAGSAVGQPRATRRVNVLLVTSDPAQAEAVATLLADTPGNKFGLERVPNSGAALKRLTRGGTDVVLFELVSAATDKLEDFLRLQHGAPAVPIVVLAAADDEAAALQAALRGAADYLLKGLTESNALVRSLLFAIERHKRRRAEYDLNVVNENVRNAWEARQQRMPRGTPVVAGFDVAGDCHQTDVTGGDYFDYVPLAGGGLGVVVADVSGHGISPATRMAETRAYLRAFAQTTADLSEIVRSMNTALADDPIGTHFVTLLLVRLDPSQRRIRFVNAGHPTGYVCSATGEVRGYLHSGSTPLGVLREAAAPPTGELELEPGDAVVIVTDGILEAQAPDGTTFGAQRVLRAVRRHARDHAAGVVEGIYRDVRAFCEYLPPRDDVTAVVAKAAGG